MVPLVHLEAGGAQARLLPGSGGRVSSLRLVQPSGAVVDVLHPYPEDYFDAIRWAKGGIYPLMPYSNRIRNATLRTGGRTVPLAAHPDAVPHTLHGNAHVLPWQLERRGAASAEMVLTAQASAAWPWRYRGRLQIDLAPTVLTIAISVCNDDKQDMPAGIGLHPYFRHLPDARVGYQAASVWPPDADFIATAARAARSDEVLAPARSLRAGGLTDYLGDWSGEATVELPEGAVLRIAADPVFSHLVVHRPDQLSYLCLEPVSHVADAFNLAADGIGGTGTRWLAPGQSMGGTIRFELLAPAVSGGKKPA